jgi:glucosamine--fructose-6-phosphate aminotransferase (isomerizing)
MCGIVGYIGKSPAKPILLQGLKRMEYRGYDSAGLAIVEEKNVEICKKSGKLQELVSVVQDKELAGTVGIGHIRWATHGVPNDVNAHPHADCNNEIYLIHNGIIENFQPLKDRLAKLGHEFVTQTDTEVLVHLVEEHMKNKPALEDAVQAALREVVGAYGIAVVSSRDPEKLVAARFGSPLILGIIGKGEYIVASDATAILPHTREVIYLEERDIVTVTPKGYKIKTLGNKLVKRPSNHIEWDTAQAEKKGYPHFMMKEIMEQPQVVIDGLRGRLIPQEGIAHLGGFIEESKRWREIERIVIVACGSASYAAMVGQYMIEEYVGIPVTVDVGSEFRYRSPVLDKKNRCHCGVSVWRNRRHDRIVTRSKTSRCINIWYGERRRFHTRTRSRRRHVHSCRTRSGGGFDKSIRGHDQHVCIADHVTWPSARYVDGHGATHRT